MNYWILISTIVIFIIFMILIIVKNRVPKRVESFTDSLDSPPPPPPTPNPYQNLDLCHHFHHQNAINVENIVVNKNVLIIPYFPRTYTSCK